MMRLRLHPRRLGVGNVRLPWLPLLRGLLFVAVQAWNVRPAPALGAAPHTAPTTAAGTIGDFESTGTRTAHPVPADVPPHPVSDAAWRPLTDCSDTLLAQHLDRELARRPRWMALARAGDLAVGLVDLSRIDQPRFAQVNGDRMMRAASLAKIGILLAAHQALTDGTLQDSRELQRDLTEMIRVSSNEAATHVIDRLGQGLSGLKRIAAVLTLPRYALYDPSRGGGLWVGSRYPVTGDSLPDPQHGLLHAATATQVCRFYHMLAAGRLVSEDASFAMLYALSEPALQTKFVLALERRDPKAKSRIYRKSGTWGRYHADSVLVWGTPPRRYIAVALVEDQDGERLLQDLLPALEAALRTE